MPENSGPRLEVGDGPNLILVGVDGSDTSMRAGAYAAGLARRQKARLVVLYVAPTTSLAGLMPAGAGAAADAHNDLASELRREVDGRAGDVGVAATFELRRGDPFTEFCRVADEMKADSVVVGVSTHAGHRLMGSLGVKLVRAGRWPVTVVP